MKLFKRCAAFVLAMSMAFGLVACGEEKKPAADAPAAGFEKITFVLDWTPNTNHTGLYVAIANNYFTDVGLDVQVVQPPEDGAEVLVASGKAQFGVSFQDYLAPALVEGMEMPITAVAAVIQHNTSGIISRAGEGMDTPKGLEGKKYATWDLPVEKATMAQVMAADGGDFSKVERIPSTVTDEVSALKSGNVDAIWIYYAWAGKACEVAGLDTDYFAFADMDPVFDYYSPVIIANNDYLAENPQQAKAFLSALAKGYAYAVENPVLAADILMEAAPELKSNPELVYQSQGYLAQQYQAEAVRWGEFDGERWARFYTWLNENDLLEGDVDPNSGFTNDYLP